MAGRTPEEALDAYVGRLRTALSCITNATLFGTGTTLADLHSLTLYAPGQTEPNRVRLHTHGGSGELILRVVQRYSVVFQPDVVQRSPFDLWTSYYQYRILDREEREIVVYHWEPAGRSPVITPHLHVSAAAPVTLPQPDNSSVTGRTTHLNKLHLPTGRIGLEEIVELLVYDFAVDPLIPNWTETLTKVRATGSHS